MSTRIKTIIKEKNLNYLGYKNIVVITKSSTYEELGPYVLEDDEGRISDNFSKVYKEVPKGTERYSCLDKTIVW